jgi:hypothetical protein
MVSFGEYFDDKGFSDYMKFLYQEINIYNKQYSTLNQPVFSPLANTAPTFYKIYIADTSFVKDRSVSRFFFSPRNKK